MKKKILSVLIAATLTLSLTACGGNGEQKGGDSGEGGLSGEITVWSWDVALAHLEAQAEKFQEKYPDVELILKRWGCRRSIRK